MTNEFKTLDDLDLEMDALSENTVFTLAFVLNHYNSTRERFHITHDKDDSMDTICRLCGMGVDIRYCGWNYHSDCDDNNKHNTLSSCLAYHLINKIKIERELQEVVDSNRSMSLSLVNV